MILYRTYFERADEIGSTPLSHDSRKEENKMAFFFGKKDREALLRNLGVLLAANGQKSIMEMVSGAESQVKTMNTEASTLEAQAKQASDNAHRAYAEALEVANKELQTHLDKVRITRNTANGQRAMAESLAAAAAALK